MTPPMLEGGCGLGQDIHTHMTDTPTLISVTHTRPRAHSCFNNSLPCRLRIRGGGDVLASYAQQRPRAQQKSVRQDRAEPRGKVGDEEGESKEEDEDLVDDDEDELGDEREKDAAGGEVAAMDTLHCEEKVGAEGGDDDDDGPPEGRALFAMVVERMQARAMMEAYAQAVVELHRQGAVDAEAARAVL